MDSYMFLYYVAQEYNLTRKPVFEKFIQAYDGEIKYVFSQDYIIGLIDTDGMQAQIHSGIRLSSWGNR